MDAVKENFEKVFNGKKKVSKAVLLTAIQVLDKTLPVEVLEKMFLAFDPTGVDYIDYIDFIDWLYNSLEPCGGGADAVATGLEKNGDPAQPPQQIQLDRSASMKSNTVVERLFLCHQHTAQAVEKRNEWMDNRVPQDNQCRVSTPPFNMRLKIDLPKGAVSLNVATFGVRLPRAIMALFEPEDIKTFAKERKIPIPPYKLDSFVQRKMPKVMDMMEAAKKHPLYIGDNVAAVSKVEAFCADFKGLSDKTITGPKAFQDVVEKHCPPGWEDNLHFDHVLPFCFGFTQDFSDQLKKQEFKEEDDSVVTFEHHSLRWLTKAFKGYGPVGCLTDLVNLLYAMFDKQQPDVADEKDVVDLFQRFKENYFDKKDFSGLWIPTHIVHDAESDDSLSWLLLDYMYDKMGKKGELEVMIQLPALDECNQVAEFFKTHPTKCVIFRDENSENKKAVLSCWKPFVEAK